MKVHFAFIIAAAFTCFTIVVIVLIDHNSNGTYKEATQEEQARYRIEDSIRIAKYTDTFQVKIGK